MESRPWLTDAATGAARTQMSAAPAARPTRSVARLAPAPPRIPTASVLGRAEAYVRARTATTADSHGAPAEQPVGALAAASASATQLPS